MAKDARLQRNKKEKIGKLGFRKITNFSNGRTINVQPGVFQRYASIAMSRSRIFLSFIMKSSTFLPSVFHHKSS